MLHQLQNQRKSVGIIDGNPDKVAFKHQFNNPASLPASGLNLIPQKNVLFYGGGTKGQETTTDGNKKDKNLKV